MPGNGPIKLKLLYLLDIFKNMTDEEHPMNAHELHDALLKYDINAERKSIYSAILELQIYGYDIVQTRKPKHGYFMGKRLFEMAEVRLFMDAVQAAKFISPEKSKEMIQKLLKSVSIYQAQTLNSQVYVYHRGKRENEGLFENIEIIHTAISRHQKIQVVYHQRKSFTKDVSPSGSKTLIVSPYALIWSNDHYYLIGNNEKYDNIMHLRVDRMEEVCLLDARIRPFEEVSVYQGFFDAADYAQKTFNMFSGKQEIIEIRCKNEMLDEIIDHFGSNISIRASGDHHFLVRERAMISEGLVSWILQFGANVEVISPQSMRDQVTGKIMEMKQLYMR